MRTITVSRMFAIAVREVVPTLVRRQQSYTFAEHRCAWTIREDRMVETSMQRLALCASELLRQGFVSFDARARPLRSGGCALSLRIAGAGPLRQTGDVQHMLSSLGLEASGREGGGTQPAPPLKPQLMRAHGSCLATGVRIDFAALPLVGFVFNAIYMLPHALPIAPDAHDAASEANGSAPRLWLLQPDTLNAASVIAQAQTHGWAVSAFTSALQVRQRLRRRGPAQARPGVFVCFMRDAASIEEALMLANLLAPATHRIGAVEIGADWVNQSELAESYELACHPFCHDDWTRWTTLFAARADEASGTTEPVPFALDDRLVILIVDDDAFSRELTAAMVHALGYDSVLASDGEEAIERCRGDGPSLVLMDLEMPVLDGYEATRRLRALQQAGGIASCRIIAYSSCTEAEAVQRALLAGADTFLPKPVPLETLRAELQRWCIARHRSSTASSSAPLRSVTSTPTLLR